MALHKRKGPLGCVIGCIVVLLLFTLVLGIVAAALLHAPNVSSLTRRLSRKTAYSYTAVLAEGDQPLHLEELSMGARQTYNDLQACYNAYMQEQRTPIWEEEETPADTAAAMDAETTQEAPTYAFPCSGVVEFCSAQKSETDDDFAYGMVIYTDTLTSSLDIFVAYHTQYSNNHDEAASSPYYLFVRGNALVIGNRAGLIYLYVNSLI